MELLEHAGRRALGAAAAASVADIIRVACARRGEARVIFACSQAQTEFMAALVRKPIAWAKVVIFHTDEYLGVRAEDPRSRRRFLHGHLLSRIDPPRAVHWIFGEKDPLHECARYARLLTEKPLHLACLDIGKGGEIGFNDRASADFEDAQSIKVVELDEERRAQEAREGVCDHMNDVPSLALTVTLPALAGAQHVSCVAPGQLNARAIRERLPCAGSPDWPASILCTHPHAELHIEALAPSSSEE